MIQEEKLLNYLDKTLSTAEHQEVQTALEASPELRKQLEELRELTFLLKTDPHFQPSERLDANFHKMLVQEMAKQTPIAKVIPMRKRFSRQWQIAAGFLLMVSLLTGVILFTNSQHKQQLAALENQMDQNRRLMFNLMEGESASGRIQAVNLSMEQTKSDDSQTFQALSRVLNTDDNLNVRLAALDALAQFSDSQEVRKLLLEALEKQNEPITQIALIQMLVQLEEKGIVPQLQELINHPILEQPVKDEAYNGLVQLGEKI